ncbi:hypothetical protein Ancab_001028 [Ancistrocladus abbreviatus]
MKGSAGGKLCRNWTLSIQASLNQTSATFCDATLISINGGLMAGDGEPQVWFGGSNYSFIAAVRAR